MFFRDEFQEQSGNLSHIHGLIALHKGNMNNKEFRELVCSLQRNAVCDLFLTDEIQGYMDEGLFKNNDDWKTCTAQADEILTHKCDDRCKIRVGSSGTLEDFRCRKKHPVFDSVDPLSDDYIPINHKWSDPCLVILEECGL